MQANFTPAANDGQRWAMLVDNEELEALRRAGDGQLRGIVYDRNSQKCYRVYQKACGLGCVCDSLAVPVE